MPGLGGEPLLAERGEAVPISIDGAEVGTASVDDWLKTPGDGSTSVTIQATYTAKSDWALDPGAWELLTADGIEVPLAADPPMPGSLGEGQSATYTLVTETDVDLEGAFIAYVDTEAATFVFVVALE